MDLRAEFAIPPSASQVIEWESGGEEAQGVEVEHQEPTGLEEESSPIFRRQQPVPSPVLRSRRRQEDVSNQKPAWLPTKRKLDLEEDRSEKFLRRENSTFFQSSLVGGNASLPSLSSWLAHLSPSSSTSSCQVSSCDSLAGLAPQPPAEGPRGLTGTAWLAGIEEKESDMLGGVDSDSEMEEDEDELIQTSDKKKKPVKNGLVSKLESCLKWEKSKRALAKYQLDQGDVSDEVERKMVVEMVRQEGDLFMIVGKTGTVMINKEFCLSEPVVGDMVTFPLPKVSTMVEGKEVLLGVTNINIESVGGTREEEEEQYDDTVQPTSLLCPCLSLTPALCSRNAPPSSSPSPSISPMTGLNIVSSGTTSPTPVKVSTIRQVVERVGGCSSSPQQVTYRKSRREQQMLELVVHRVFTRHRRTGVNMTLDTTVGEDEVGVSLLCEDQAGDFSVIKLDSELRKEESWNLLFGSNWEVVVGSKVIITSPLHVQDRITRSNKQKLFSVIWSIRNTNQRFCYVMKAFPGSTLELVEVGVVETDCVASLARAKGCRVNLRVMVLYFDRDKGQLYMQDHPPKGQAYWEATISPSIPLSAQLPVTALVTGLSVDSHGHLILDNYSAIMAVTCTSLDCSTLPTFSSACKRGDLVRVEGVVLRVDQEASIQWMECNTCQSDQLLNSKQGWNCTQCGSSNEASHKVELVCFVKGVWVRLKESARKVLPGEGGGSFQPSDVIGHVLPAVICRVGEDLVAIECS